MIHDPFLDGPREPRGCVGRTLRIFAVEAACGLVLAAGVVWSLGDAIAVAALLALVWVLVTVGFQQVADLRHVRDDDVESIRTFDRFREELGR